MQAIQPYNPNEEDEIVAIATGKPRRAWTIQTSKGQYMLVWAMNGRQAAAIARHKASQATIRSVRPNYHAQNMTPKPFSWSEYVTMGGN